VRGYELTGRGKFLVAVLIIVILLTILAFTPIFRGLSRNTPPDDSPHDQDIHQNDATPAPVAPERDSETDSCDVPASQNGSNDDSAVIDIDAGILTFQFSPASQKTLSDSTLSMIGELAKSQKYTADSMFTVEIPQLSDDDDAVRLTTAIIEAFTSFDVPLGDIILFIYKAESGAATFEIKISLV